MRSRISIRGCVPQRRPPSVPSTPKRRKSRKSPTSTPSAAARAENRSRNHHHQGDSIKRLLASPSSLPPSPTPLQAAHPHLQPQLRRRKDRLLFPPADIMSDTAVRLTPAKLVVIFTPAKASREMPAPETARECDFRRSRKFNSHRRRRRTEVVGRRRSASLHSSSNYSPTNRWTVPFLSSSHSGEWIANFNVW